MTILPLSKRLLGYLEKHQLVKMFEKQKALFETNHFHPSLHTELLEPHRYRVYSFRITKKYRAVFVYVGSDMIKILDINDHYQ